MQLEFLLLYASVWSSLDVLSAATAEYPFEALRVSLIARIRSHGNYGHVHSSLGVVYRL